MTHTIIIIDMGHGANCPGKCSPDGSFHEWKFNREVGKALGDALSERGFTVRYTHEADTEPLYPGKPMLSKAQLNECLRYRYAKVNEYCAQYGSRNCLCISIHANASGSTWSDARGFCAIVGRNASAASKRLAQSIYAEAAKAHLQGNRCVPPERYWTQPLAICEHTRCPAVLTESLFYTNRHDLALLQSQEGKNTIVEVHLRGILNYLNHEK
ncbi:MAG: N-acetylmuramoyl-L-alanine amidase [Bacteroidales bacterium]|nr:N-acetylmuramoyl-L-alanine amidase [Bacteroidales bacterium]